MEKVYSLGVDVGSTTIKYVLLDPQGIEVEKEYRRHRSDVRRTFMDMLRDLASRWSERDLRIYMTGSAGIGISSWLEIPFMQEVIASTRAIERTAPDTDVAIELGGEDAKITYLSHAVEQRMNGTCAGGTGAFIDQMASLMETDPKGLNDLAKEAKQIYPIASRCGVFAKSDVQPLLNEGVRREDIAASILQAIVTQTIGGLAQGRPIRGKVAFLGGPLTFLSELRVRFIETLRLTEPNVVHPADAQYFVAMGAAYGAEEDSDQPIFQLQKLTKKMTEQKDHFETATQTLDPLFQTEEDLVTFRKRHATNQVAKGELASYRGKAFLGIDSGSTTTKIALVGENHELLYSFYEVNQGSPLKTVIREVKKLYETLPETVVITGTGVTGYGEALIQKALHIDVGEVETIAHYRAARYFRPDVDFIIDIGGQDMKSLRIRDGMIDSIMLNEACSSGCGSFIQTFASALGVSVENFAKQALESKAPVDLGTRCTVFMNSRVKESQRQGATVSDISAGIAYSVVKNALYKVIRIHSPEDLGKSIVVQGGTFYNEAVLRAFELETGVEVIRPDIAGLMGAFGVALLAQDRCKSTGILTKEELSHFDYTHRTARCKGCSNNCLLTINKFNDKTSYISGNRCEKGLGLEKKKDPERNLSLYKYQRVFDYHRTKPVSRRERIGIPRVLNLYENYPFWYTLFDSLGFEVVLSHESNRKLYDLGLESIPSESVCYPAKIAHGHIEDLVNQGVSHIFYPSVPYNQQEDSIATNRFNCPVVASYPDVLKGSIEAFKDQVKFMHPYLSFDNPKALVTRLMDELSCFQVSKGAVKIAVDAAYMELDRYHKDIQKAGEHLLELLAKEGGRGIVLAGRPYHVDPEINHGIPDLVEGEGFAIFTEDSISHLGELKRPLTVHNQWTYHARLYRAAAYVASQPNLEMIQLTSFGCGLDAITTDEVKEILEYDGKTYTLLKIDEISNLGAARIRIRSLKAALEERKNQEKHVHIPKPLVKRTVFTEEMKKTHTILVPQMAPYHFDFIATILRNYGYKVVILPEIDYEAVTEGVKVVHNDACYPAVLTTGQFVRALKSGDYDLDRTAILMSQTGGGCRATNYISFIRKALRDLDMQQVPVISFNFKGLEGQPGFNLPSKAVMELLRAVIYGDLLMKCVCRTRPYEKEAGSVEVLYEAWNQKIQGELKKGQTYHRFQTLLKQIIADFDHIPLNDIHKPKVGIVGEILVKFHPTANNQVVKELEKEGAEVVVPELFNFLTYYMYSNIADHRYLGGGRKNRIISETVIQGLQMYTKSLRKALDASQRFSSSPSIYHKADLVKDLVSTANKMGEGWLLTAEMIELLQEGVPNIVCVQPFACLPNHISGKGLFKALRDAYPMANIVPIDYDPGTSEVNQINRIKLMMSIALRQGNQSFEVIS
ncbi:acyl-CoA dehydratase activase-related protein [Gottschalkiaceae bacterium SANA]|nr:acyl-CoA dehydratase activase-related protein [Gottschalkiaceae bacterium SANA]